MTIAIIGTGWGTRVQVPAFRSAGLDVLALAGSNKAKTERIAADFGVPHGYGDWRAVLERDDVQLVSIVTPPHLHREMAVAALQAGKHVLCEKPTALDAGEAQAMLDAAQAHPGQLALIDHELRFLPSLRHARQMIAEGQIGSVRLVVGSVFGGGRADPNRAWNWWSDVASGGGMLGAIGSHQIDTVRYLLGAEPAQVAATLRTFVTERPADHGPRPVTSDDTYSLRLRFTNDAHVALDGSVVLRLDEPNSVTAYGDAGTLRWRDGRLLHATPGGEWRDITPQHQYTTLEGQTSPFPHATVYLAHALRAFLDGDMAAVAPAATFADGLRIQQTLDAARASDRNDGRMVDVGG